MIKINNETVPVKYFPDGTLNIKGNPKLNDGTVLLSWHYEYDGEYMIIAFLTRYYQSRGNKVDLFMPYVPNARMDRVENDEDIFTMKYFAEQINNLNFNKVFVMDVHSSVAVATIENIVIINIDAIVKKVVKKIEQATRKEVLLFYPDEGAMKRYSKETDNPYAFAVKNRDWETGKILGLKIFGVDTADVKGKNVLIRDDICSKGGTCYYVAKKLKEMGADKVFIYVTHCENAVLDGEFGENKRSLLDTGLIECLFTTNSICTLRTHRKIGIIDVNLKAFGDSSNSSNGSKCIRGNCDDCGYDCKHDCNDNYDNGFDFIKFERGDI